MMDRSLVRILAALAFAFGLALGAQLMYAALALGGRL